MAYEYYYNNVPGVGLTRNNLIYTSLINKEKNVFVQWYYNKWEREVKYLKLMTEHYPQHVPKIYKIDHAEKKIFLKVEGIDFWNRADCDQANYDAVLPNWQDQMLEIIQAHKSLGLHKYSMHPSSYFVVNGKLKSINYFFTYHKHEDSISIEEVESHIHSNRQTEMKKHLDTLGIEWNKPQPWTVMDKLCWNSFRTNYPEDFIEKALNV